MLARRGAKALEADGLIGGPGGGREDFRQVGCLLCRDWRQHTADWRGRDRGLSGATPQSASQNPKTRRFVPSTRSSSWVDRRLRRPRSNSFGSGACQQLVSGFWLLLRLCCAGRSALLSYLSGNACRTGQNRAVDVASGGRSVLWHGFVVPPL